MSCRGNDLAEVVRNKIGSHADGDTAGTVDEQVRKRSGQDDGFALSPVIVRNKINYVLVESGGQFQSRFGQTCLGVTHGGRSIIGRTKIAVAIDQGQTQGERLGEPDQRVVDGRITVRVKAAHDLSDHSCALHVSPVGSQAHLGHLEKNATLHGFEAVASVRQGSGVDDRIRVLQEGRAHLLGDVGIKNPATGGRGLRRTSSSGLACRLTRH